MGVGVSHRKDRREAEDARGSSHALHEDPADGDVNESRGSSARGDGAPYSPPNRMRELMNEDEVSVEIHRYAIGWPEERASDRARLLIAL